jgi:hypothetical protein
MATCSASLRVHDYAVGKGIAMLAASVVVANSPGGTGAWLEQWPFFSVRASSVKSPARRLNAAP